MNYDISLNLSALFNVKTTEKNGKKYIIIPFEENGLFEGKKGVYLNLYMLDKPNEQYGTTHSLQLKKTAQVKQYMEKQGLKFAPQLAMARASQRVNPQQDKQNNDTYSIPNDMQKPKKDIDINDLPF